MRQWDCWDTRRNEKGRWNRTSDSGGEETKKRKRPVNYLCPAQQRCQSKKSSTQLPRPVIFMRRKRKRVPCLSIDRRDFFLVSLVSFLSSLWMASAAVASPISPSQMNELEAFQKQVEDIRSQVESVRKQNQNVLTDSDCEQKALPCHLSVRRVFKVCVAFSLFFCFSCQCLSCQFQGHFGKIYSLEWSRDNLHVVSAAQDGKVCVLYDCSVFLLSVPFFPLCFVFSQILHFCLAYFLVVVISCFLFSLFPSLSFVPLLPLPLPLYRPFLWTSLTYYSGTPTRRTDCKQFTFSFRLGPPGAYTSLLLFRLFFSPCLCHWFGTRTRRTNCKQFTVVWIGYSSSSSLFCPPFLLLFFLFCFCIVSLIDWLIDRSADCQLLIWDANTTHKLQVIHLRSAWVMPCPSLSSSSLLLVFPLSFYVLLLSCFLTGLTDWLIVSYWFGMPTQHTNCKRFIFVPLGLCRARMLRVAVLWRQGDSITLALSSP